MCNDHRCIMRLYVHNIDIENDRVGQAMASPEDKAYEIMRELDVNYVLVIFGGLTGYSSDGKSGVSRREDIRWSVQSHFCRLGCNFQLCYLLFIYLLIVDKLLFIDINKFLWMVRIGGSTPEGEHIKVGYFSPKGNYFSRHSIHRLWFCSLLFSKESSLVKLIFCKESSLDEQFFSLPQGV